MAAAASNQGDNEGSGSSNGIGSGSGSGSAGAHPLVQAAYRDYVDVVFVDPSSGAVREEGCGEGRGSSEGKMRDTDEAVMVLRQRAAVYSDAVPEGDRRGVDAMTVVGAGDGGAMGGGAGVAAGEEVLTLAEAAHVFICELEEAMLQVGGGEGGKEGGKEGDSDGGGRVGAKFFGT
jgi:hypothetical protein